MGKERKIIEKYSENSKTVLTGLYTKRNIAPSDPETEKIKINAEDE